MNFRHQVSNVITLRGELETAAGIAMGQARRYGTRALLVVQAVPEIWLKKLAGGPGAVYVDAQSITDRADRISAVLGSERQLVIIQLAHRPDLGLLAAVAGTIVAGGLLIVSTYTPLQNIQHSHSSQRLLRLAGQLAARFPGRVISMDCLPAEAEGASSCVSHQPLPRTPNQNAVTEQAALLTKACAHLDAHPGGCLVVRGRRGRGKSTLLARIAMHLEQRGARFQITAMHESALQIYRQHIQSTTARYVSPENAVSKPPAILLVEEASSFALSKLQTYLKGCHHVILCTTTEGYEMSGRALDIRLLADVVCYEKPVLQLEPMQPWRWAENDPLEQFLDALLLNQTHSVTAARTITPNLITGNTAIKSTIRRIPQEELHSNEALLSSVHVLLLEAHYQTTPKDLEHLLDAPTVQLWIQQVNESLVGVLLLEFEGPIEPDLHHAIMTRSRRPPHQLLPQLLAQTANMADALHMRYARVIRIAIVKELRRQGLATALLDSVTTRMTRPVDAIGASFAADGHTIAFWKKQGYTEFHRGFRANPRTGKHAVAVLRCFNLTTRKMLQCAANINADNELARQAADDATVHMLSEQTHGTTQIELSRQDRQLLKRFAAGQRSQHDTFAALQRLFKLTKQNLPVPESISRRHYELELRRLVQQWADSGSQEPGRPSNDHSAKR